MHRAADLAAFIDEARRGVEHAIEEALPRPPDCPAILSEAMRYSVFAGGKRLRPLLALAPFALVLALGVATHQRNLLYRDEVSLWSDTVRKSPNKARPHNNLGHAYAMQDNWDRAIEEFRIAARLDPDYAPARKNLRDAYLHQVGRQ